MGIIDNTNKTLKDDMLVTLKQGSKVAVARVSDSTAQRLKPQCRLGKHCLLNRRNGGQRG